jgi:hypothetical protein
MSRHSRGIDEGTLLALLQIDKRRLIAPVQHGDCVHAEQTVSAKKAASKPHRGAVGQRHRLDQSQTIQSSPSRFASPSDSSFTRWANSERCAIVCSFGDTSS